MLFYSSWQTNQIRPFVFWENLWLPNLLFDFIWHLGYGLISWIWWILKTQGLFEGLFEYIFTILRKMQQRASLTNMKEKISSLWWCSSPMKLITIGWYNFWSCILIFFSSYCVLASCLISKFTSLVFCYQNCSDLLWEKNVLVIKKNF